MFFPMLKIRSLFITSITIVQNLKYSESMKYYATVFLDLGESENLVQTALKKKYGYKYSQITKERLD